MVDILPLDLNNLALDHSLRLSIFVVSRLVVLEVMKR